MLDNRMLCRIFVPKSDEVTGGWRKCNDELHNLFSSSVIIRVLKSSSIKWAGNVVCMDEMRNLHKGVVAKSEEKRSHK
jgi:hypothetical protein